MKKKLIALLTVALVICCALWLVACNATNVVEVENIELDVEQITLTEGEKTLLTATITPSNATHQKLEWTSSDHAVAIVEDGYVVTFGEGATTITAKSSNGKTAQCSITVKADPNDSSVMKFDVKFDANGGKFLGGSDCFETTADWGSHLEPVTVSRDGKYKFAGWYIKGQPASGAWDFDTNSVYGDTTLYAKWDYENSYETVTSFLEYLAQNYHVMNDREIVDVDIISLYKDDNGYLCFIGKDRYGVRAYRTYAKDFDEVDIEIISQLLYTTVSEIDSYDYTYNSDNDSYIADYLPIKYPDIRCSVIYACVDDWVYYYDDFYTQAKGPYYSCEVKALMTDEDGNVFTYTATIIAPVTNFNAVVGGSSLSVALNGVVTPLGDLAKDYYAEYLKTQEANILY